MKDRSGRVRCPQCGIEMHLFGGQTAKSTMRAHRQRGACVVDAAAYYAGLGVPPEETTTGS